MRVVEFYCCFWSLVSARNPDSSEQNSIIWKKLISGVLLPIRLPPSLHSLHFTSLRSRNIISTKIFIITANSYSTVLTFAKFSLACYVIFVCVLVYCHHLFYYWDDWIQHDSIFLLTSSQLSMIICWKNLENLIHRPHNFIR